MQRNVTALYRSHATVDLLCDELQGIGVSRGDIRVVPDQTEGLGHSGLGSEPQPVAALHGLDLPDEDVRAYEDRVRSGDVLVSVQVDEDRVPEVERIMRRPENFAHMHERRGVEAVTREVIYPDHGVARTETVEGGLRDDGVLSGTGGTRGLGRE